MSFLDAYTGYNQIELNPVDEEHISFITPQGLQCYRVMPFGSKNAGTSFQRLVSILFKELLGKTMETYVDDLLVKIQRKEDHLGQSRKCSGYSGFSF